MPLNFGSLAPIKPYSLTGGSKKQGGIMMMPVAASQTIVPGLILTYAVGKVSIMATGAFTANFVYGVSMNSITTGASPTDSDRVQVCPAFPGQIYEGSLVNGTTDITAADYSTTFLPAVGNGWRLITQDVDAGSGTLNYHLLDITTNDTAGMLPIAYSPDQTQGRTFRSGTGGNLNPRVLFVFNSTFFQNA